MSRQVDLNELRRVLSENAQTGQTLPAVAQRKVVVDREGRIALGDDVGGDPRQLSEVHQGVFAQLPSCESISLLPFPPGSEIVEVDHVRGCLYRLNDPYGALCTLFAWHDGRSFQVSVVEPRFDDLTAAEAARLTSDGRIRPGAAGGFATAAEALLASAMWLVWYRMRDTFAAAEAGRKAEYREQSR